MPLLSGMPRLLSVSVLRAGRSVLLCLLISMVMACAVASDSGRARDLNNGERVEGEYIVELVGRDSARAQLERAFGDHGLERIDALETNQPLYLIRLTPDPGPAVVREWASEYASIRRVEPNYRYSGDGGATGLSDDSGQ